jgi:type I restriction enzyme M protein
MIASSRSRIASRRQAGGYTPSLAYPYRWRDWASPRGEVRQQLWEAGQGALFGFVHNETVGLLNQDGTYREYDGLLKHLHELRDQPGISTRQRLVSEIMSSVERVRLDTERNFLDVLDKVDEITLGGVDTQHMFLLSQAYEGLLLRMGEKNNDGGQFFTPREVIRAMVQVIDPQIGERIYDPASGTGGFLAEAYEYMVHQADEDIDPLQLEVLKEQTFYGREKENLIYPIALANLVLHGIDAPHIWHGNTLTGNVRYDGLYAGAPALYDVILTNPPFGGKEGKEAQTNFAYKTSATQVLFLQHVIDSLKNGGRCGIVLDEGVLFRTNETAFVQTKRKLLDQCDVWCIVSLPAGTFIGAGGGVKTNILFFQRGQPTERIWYYDLSDVKVTKRKPLTLDVFAEFFDLYPTRADSAHSWTITRDEIEARNFDLKAVNPNAASDQDMRTPDELLDLIEAKGREVEAALAKLRAIGR